MNKNESEDGQFYNSQMLAMVNIFTWRVREGNYS